MRTQNVIIIPGLGGKYHLYERAVAGWRSYGLHAHVFQINWEDDESYADKQRRLLAFIHEIAGDTHVALVGVSAGASAALNAYRESDSVQSVITICGFINYEYLNPAAMNRRAAAFTQSLKLLRDNYDGLGGDKVQRVLHYTAYADKVAIPAAGKLQGATERKIAAFGHLCGIAVALLLYAHPIKKWILRYN